MTKDEAAIVAAYTGFMLGSFPDFHDFVEKLLGRPIWTHELATAQLQREIQEAAKPLFIALEVE